jgi:hypothetical protein
MVLDQEEEQDRHKMASRAYENWLKKKKQEEKQVR